MNSRSPFQKFQGYYYTTVVLLTRFIYSVLTRAQLKNKTYQIHGGFVFEEKVSQDLAAGGFQLKDIVRINRQEFDVITIKNKKVYNFQCKNNFINISSINPDYIIISRLIKRLCTYYEKALIKERGRERLIVDKTGIGEIEHFVISR